MAVPLVFVIVISMSKDAYEDYKRHQADDSENNASCMVLNTSLNTFNTKRWKNLSPGDLLMLKNDEMIPADLLILHTSSEKGTAYVETKNLDGETNLKIKQANK
jgi:P-type E1-E2 ATPase